MNFICVYQVWSKLIEKYPSKIQYGHHESFFCHFNIRPRWFPAHHRDRLVSYMFTLYLITSVLLEQYLVWNDVQGLFFTCIKWSGLSWTFVWAASLILCNFGDGHPGRWRSRVALFLKPIEFEKSILFNLVYLHKHGFRFCVLY